MKRQRWVMMGLLVVGWIIILNQPNAVSTRMRSVVTGVASSFLKVGNFLPSIRTRRALAAENEKLKAENEKLRQDMAQANAVLRENIELRRLLRLSGGNPNQMLIGARVIGRDTSNWWKTVQIDVGSTHGIRVDQPVVNADGLVGRVIEVTGGESRVLLVVDPNCKVSAVMQDSREPGIVVGGPSAFAVNPICRMTFVGREASVGPGQKVVTSGLGGVFPKGIPIGTVDDARLNSLTGMYQDVDIKPAVDFHRLEHVMVMVNR